jgi:hypothetical protein
MALNLKDYEKLVETAVNSFWATRQSSGVRGGKTLDGFIDVFQWVVRNNGMPNATFLLGRKAQVPGFFRVSKLWDLLVLDGDVLVAAIELKSIADSFGKNANNRGEEVLGSGVDLKAAFEEGAFDNTPLIFTGYLILVEDCPETSTDVGISSMHFQAMQEFMANPATRDSIYLRAKDGRFPKIPGVSYQQRFDIMCRRLMQKKLYTAASVVTAKRCPTPTEDVFSRISKETGVKAFLASLAAHIEKVVAIKES